MTEPRELVEKLEARAELPEGLEERFAGYGVMGLPFASGQILAMRRFPASSVGPGYTSVWHRDGEGRWTFFQDAEPQQSCPRYFGSAIAEAIASEIEIRWTGPRSFSVTVQGDRRLNWQASLSTSAATRAMNLVGSLIPSRLWRNTGVLRLMGLVASAALGAGRLGLSGRTPNGQSFMANPKLMWLIPSSEATLDGQDLGEIGPIPVQERLGDFWIPQRGIFVIGEALFEPFDEERHVSATARAQSA